MNFKTCPSLARAALVLAVVTTGALSAGCQRPADPATPSTTTTMPSAPASAASR